MARPLRVEYPGAVYHVITRGNNRQPIFGDDADRLTYLGRLTRYCEQKAVHQLGYCLLSNHTHLLLETPRGNLSKLMQPFHTSYTGAFNRRHGRTGHVFEQRYKAFVVDRDNYLVQVSRYIHLNPVRAKLVGRPQDYRWSSYRGYVRAKGGADLHRALILGQFGGTERQAVVRYRRFVEAGLKGSAPVGEWPITGQVVVGDEAFGERVMRASRHGQRSEGRYGLGEIARGVSAVSGVDAEDVQRPSRVDRVQRGRELLMYLTRRYSGASLREIGAHLRVRDISTISHGMRRAEARLKSEPSFQRQVEQIMKHVRHSRIQA